MWDDNGGWTFSLEEVDSYVTLDHKISHKGQFLEIEIYTSSESWINKLSLMYGLLG